MRGYQRSDGLLSNFYDGSDFNSHQLFQSSHPSLQVNLYFDDVEICNPLGSKAKVHKLGMLFTDDIIYGRNTCI